jgi:tRNA (cytidine/uridine-2'-O-)-methyltransferase
MPSQTNSLFHIVLYQPEIPPNTGNIIRLCANTGCQLHVIHPLGFELDDKKLRRAGLDYHEFAAVLAWPDLNTCLQQLAAGNVYACSTKGKRAFSEPGFVPGDVFVFGPESRGLPADYLTTMPRENILRIPMRADSRSMNLSNAVSVIVYEAWSQNGFAGSTDFSS